MSIFGESKHDKHQDALEHEENEILRQIAHAGRDIAHELHDIRELLTPPPPPIQLVAHFIVTQGDSTMPTQGPLVGIAPGLSDVFTAVPVDKDGNAVALDAGVVAVVTSDDPTDTITASSADGLSFSVSVAPTATPGAFHTLTVALPDGSASSPNALPILGGTTPTPVTGFVVTQGSATASARRK